MTRQREPFGTGVAIGYRHRFTDQEFSLVAAGRPSRSMDEKWDIFYEAPFLYFYRSWTGKPVFRVEFAVDTEGADVVESLWTGLGPADPHYNTQFLEFLIVRLLLRQDMPFPMPPDGSGPEAAYKHNLVGVTPSLISSDDGPRSGPAVP